MKGCKSVKEVIDEMKEGYQASVQSEFENMHVSVKMNHDERAKQSSEIIDKHRRDISLLDQVMHRLEQEANIE